MFYHFRFMPCKKPIRILSDLHLADPGSLIRDVRQVEPLLAGAGQVVFNGDTVELRILQGRARAAGWLEDLRALCRAVGAEPLFINGNHDPDISHQNHADLLDGRLFVTHGHALFPAIAPWGRHAGAMRADYARLRAERAACGNLGLEETLEAARKACLLAPSCRVRGPRTRFQWLGAVGAELAHPRRPFQVLQAWAKLPSLAAAFAAQHRPEARCVILGHTHLPGFWRRGPRVVINTGAYFPWFGRRMVEVWEDEVSLRRVDWDGACFRPGKEVFRYALPLKQTAAPTRLLNPNLDANHSHCRAPGGAA
jgi:predicted phosphodiesterase